jgi:hypothetical protein
MLDLKRIAHKLRSVWIFLDLSITPNSNIGSILDTKDWSLSIGLNESSIPGTASSPELQNQNESLTRAECNKVS